MPKNCQKMLIFVYRNNDDSWSPFVTQFFITVCHESKFKVIFNRNKLNKLTKKLSLRISKSIYVE